MTKSQSDKLISTESSQFIKDLQEHLGNVPDFMYRRIESYTFAYISGLVDQSRIEREIIAPLINAHDIAQVALIIRTPSVMISEYYEEIVGALLKGMAVVFIEGNEKAILADVSSVPQRSISQPETEMVIQGPREAFTEVLDVNIALLRRNLKSEKLRMKVFHLGALVKFEVRLLYIEGIAEESTINEITKRISEAELDVITDSNYFAEILKDRPTSIFPTIQHTERPDVVSESLLKGKISILCDNSPFALLAPFTFWEAFQSIEDYYLMYSSATFLRSIRSLFIMLALLLPSLYVAITTFHVEMLPTNLLLSLAGSREHAPFPAMVEALIMESIFEALREAIVRLPRVLGQAVSVVGALVISQAIVQAGIVSIPMIIVVSITGIASLMIPRYEMSFAIRILRLMLLLLAGSLGFYGIALGLFAIQIYLSGVRSLGKSYLSPVTPFSWKIMKDFLIRKPYAKKESKKGV